MDKEIKKDLCSTNDIINEKISIKEKIGFGLGDTASNLLFQTFMSVSYTHLTLPTKA